MTKSTITRERVQWLHDAATEFASTKLKMTMRPDEVLALTSALLAAMDSEPHTDDELSNLLWYSQEATCHSDPNYYCEFQRLTTPGFIAGIISELQERRKVERDSEPVILYRQVNPVNGMKTYWAELDPEEFRHLKQHADENAEFMTLYRHAQPVPVVPDDVLAAIQKVARIRLDLNDFDGDRRGIADCLGDAEEALIEVVNRCAAMLATAPQEVKP
ncbi:hypothetical protein [Klebsiella variicola]|uniref:hypothetical protein n=1 Tax=Klebsiella variicola TaxID=244366 RepID=UPI00109C711B|nr:hypothetical protein [Klebsiella variicola]VGP79509.1 hypothetical protein SB5544_01405 [Klebsiella variicola]